jgi:hypothetical protein
MDSPHTPKPRVTAFEKLVFGSDVLNGELEEFDRELHRYHKMLDACSVPAASQANIFAGTHLAHPQFKDVDLTAAGRRRLCVPFEAVPSSVVELRPPFTIRGYRASGQQFVDGTAQLGVINGFPQ